MTRVFKVFLLTIVSLAVIFTLSSITWLGVRIYKDYRFSVDCKAYIKRAAVASDIDVAKEELGKAIDYIEKNNLTEGIVSIFLKNPKNDIGYWYNTLNNTYKQLMEFPRDATQLEKSNFMMRVNESIGGLSTPEGIEIYPHNVLYLWWSIISIIGAVIFIIVSVVEIEDCIYTF